MNKINKNINQTNKPQIVIFSPWIVLIFSITLTIFGFKSSLNIVYEKEKQYFYHRTELVQKEIQNRLSLYESVLIGTSGFFNLSENVNLKQWQGFTDKFFISGKFNGINALSYIEYVPAKELKSFENKMKKEYPNYKIWSLSDSNEHYIIKFTEQIKKKSKSLGFDISSNKTRLKTLIRTRNTGLPTITNKLKLISTDRPGFGLYFPVYKNGSLPEVGSERIKNFKGAVAAVFILDDLLGNIIDEQDIQQIDFHIFDGNEVSEESLLYDSEKKFNHEHNFPAIFSKISNLYIYGHTWTIIWKTNKTFNLNYSLPIIILIAGLIVSFLLFSLIRTLSFTQKMAVEIAEQMTAELKARESFIRELYETTSSQTKSFDEKISHLLKMGCEKLGLENGLLVKNEREFMEILYVFSDNESIKPKEKIPNILTLNSNEEQTNIYQIIQKRFKFEAYFGTLISINGQNYGSLDFFSSNQRKILFTSTEKTMIKLIAQWVENEIERIQVEEKIRNSLKEKEILLKEIHHRVKNNLQVVSSLLNLQSYYIKDETAIKIFRESQYRIKSMALIHQNLYQSQHLAQIDFYDYVDKLVSYLIHSYCSTPEMIKIKLEITHQPLGLDSAIPCGLIINELVSNSLKYAFPDYEEGEIFIELIYNNNFELTIRDNGVGFPEEIDSKNTESLGLQLVHTLTEQLDGDIKFESKVGKTEFKIIFSETKMLSKQS